MGRPAIAAYKYFGFGKFYPVDAAGKKLTGRVMRSKAEAAVAASIKGVPLLKSDGTEEPDDVVRQLVKQDARIADRASRAALEVALKERDERIAYFKETVETLTTERDAARDEAERYRTYWHDEREKVKRAEAERELALAKADQWRDKAQQDRATRLHAEAELRRTRGYVEGLLDGLHPQRPTLPWDHPTITSERVRVGSVEREVSTEPAFADWSSDTPRWRDP